jgi:hypothetical protein
MLEDFIDKETDICLSLAIHCMDKITAKLDSMLISCTIHQMSISRYQTIYIKLSKVNYNDFYLHRITDSVVYFDHFLKAWNLLR